MPETLTNAQTPEKNALHSVYPNIWFVEVPIDATRAIRVCMYNEDVTIYESTSAGIVAHVYDGFALTVPTLELRSDGQIPSPTVSLSNITNEVLAFVQENSSNLKGKTLRLFNVNIQFVGNSSEACTPWASIEGKIRRIIIKSNTIEFPIGFPDLHSDTVPGEYYERNYCDAGFGSNDERCGFPTSNVTDGTTVYGLHKGYDLQFVKSGSCDHGLYTPNGCAAHAALADFHHVTWTGGILPFRGCPGIVKGKGY